MLTRFYPHEYMDSVFSINYAKLFEFGFRGVIFDIDNTLVHHGADSTPEIEALLRAIHGQGLRTLLLTNNDEKRVRRFLQNADETPFIADAQKPHPKNYVKALQMLKLEASEVVVVGDQVFTDIWGANRAGIASILVKYLRHDDEKKIGLTRQLEKMIVWTYTLRKRHQHRLGEIGHRANSAEAIPTKKRRKQFGELNPIFYVISTKKENVRRHITDALSRHRFSSDKSDTRLENIISSQRSCMIKKGPGINAEHQANKTVNIRLACMRINGTIIRPGETFSFWRSIGKMTKRKGYKDGRVLINKKLTTGIGGGLCNLANAIHLLILHSPLVVTEFHKHSDALAPDEGKRVPFSSGTSVSYNHVDFRFKNTSDQCIQLLSWCDGDDLHVELRSEIAFPWTYEILEENHHFTQIDEKFYRRSHIYRCVYMRSTGNLRNKELILDNTSEVMYDYSLIPAEQIRVHNN
jgi:vancomycin resistance protein VanW